MPPALVQGNANATEINTGSATRVRNAEKVPVTGGASYIVSWATPTDVITNMSYYDDPDTTVRLGVITNIGNGRTVTIPSEASYVIFTFAPSPDTRTLSVSEFSNVMLRLATETDATFAPYSNICPISGWTGVKIYHEPEYDADANPTISVTFPDTIYGGEDEVISGKLVSDMGYIPDLGALTWKKYDVAQGTLFRAAISHIKKITNTTGKIKLFCSAYPYVAQNVRANMTCSVPTNDAQFDIIDNRYSDAETFKAAMSGVQLCYELAEPVEYTLTENEMTTLYGTNNIWANTGDVTVTYIAKSAKFSFGSPLRIYNYNNLKLFGNTYIEHGKG